MERGRLNWQKSDDVSKTDAILCSDNEFDLFLA